MNLVCPRCRHESLVETVTYSDRVQNYCCTECGLEIMLRATIERRIRPRTLEDTWSDAMREQYQRTKIRPFCRHQSCLYQTGHDGPHSNEEMCYEQKTAR